MKIKFSDFDRALIASVHRQVPWQGTEDFIVSLYELGERLELGRAFEKLKTTPIEKLSRVPSFTTNLKPDQVELLVALVAGGGQAIKGEMGPTIGELITRIRKACPKKAPPKDAAAA